MPLFGRARFSVFFLACVVCCTCIFLVSCDGNKKDAETVTGEKTITEGVITYKIKFPVLETNGAIASMLPSEVKTHFKGNKMRTELSFGFIMTTVGIADGDNDLSIVLMDLLGTKYAVKTTREELEEMGMPEYELKPDAETSKIAGYTCKKMMVTDKSNGKEFPIYATTALQVNNLYWNTPYKDVEGALFQFPINSYDIDMNLTATNVSLEPVSDELFGIPEGYKIITEDEFQQMLDDLMGK